jgi:XRE family transcriptional regulator, aerobic/anaerobic benzoate catabolism transcriptional regulator
MAARLPLKELQTARPALRAIDEGDRLLRLLGERVREARARRGMTRKILARDSGVSERYLAQLETGQGNISVLLLLKVAQSLNVPLADLMRENNGREVELTLIEQFLKRLPPHKLAEVRSQLVRDFGSTDTDRMRRIALIGLRGAGKSTLGARVARDMGCAFVELDAEIESEAGTSLSEIFLLYGQAGYRRYERRCLERVLEQKERVVIATGGSIVSEPATYDLLLSTCYTVWLRAAPEQHMERVVAQGDTRPMAGNQEAMDDLRRILDGRAALYGQADAIVDTTDKSIEQSLVDLFKATGLESNATRRSS